MSDISAELLAAVNDIREMVRLLAEPAIGERDKKRRDELRRIVGKSSAKGQAVMLMDGTRTQKQIVNESEIHQGDLSTLVKRLRDANLLSGDPKLPKVVLILPSNFFET